MHYTAVNARKKKTNQRREHNEHNRSVTCAFRTLYNVSYLCFCVIIFLLLLHYQLADEQIEALGQCKPPPSPVSQSRDIVRR